MLAEIEYEGLVAVVAIMDLTQKKCLSLDNQAKTAELLPLYQVEKMQQGMNETDRYLRGVEALVWSADGVGSLFCQICE